MVQWCFTVATLYAASSPNGISTTSRSILFPLLPLSLLIAGQRSSYTSDPFFSPENSLSATESLVLVTVLLFCKLEYSVQRHLAGKHPRHSASARRCNLATARARPLPTGNGTSSDSRWLVAVHASEPVCDRCCLCRARTGTDTGNCSFFIFQHIFDRIIRKCIDVLYLLASEDSVRDH